MTRQFARTPALYAEVYVQVGQRLLTLQADVDTTVAATKPQVIALAKLYVARLR